MSSSAPLANASSKAAQLKRRCIGGAVAIGLLAAIVFIDREQSVPWIAVSLVIALGVAGAVEYRRMVAAGGVAVRAYWLIGCVIALLVGKVLCYRGEFDFGAADLALIVLGSGTLVALAIEVIDGHARAGVERAAWGALGLAYFLMYSFLLDLLLVPRSPRGVELALWIVFVSKANDIGGYLVGNWVGGPKLAPKVSPGKTRAGSLGGMFLSFLVTYVGADALDVKLEVWELGLFALCVSIATQFGDLAESLLKRACGVKDSGTLLPTFGGALDVIDSLAFAAPVGYVFLRSFSALS
jgi:phosphatidate cytidylyltransferase